MGFYRLGGFLRGYHQKKAQSAQLYYLKISQSPSSRPLVHLQPFFPALLPAPPASSLSPWLTRQPLLGPAEGFLLGFFLGSLGSAPVTAQREHMYGSLRSGFTSQSPPALPNGLGRSGEGERKTTNRAPPTPPHPRET